MAGYMMVLGFWLQEADSLSSKIHKLLMIFIGIVAFAMLVQAIIFLAMAVGADEDAEEDDGDCGGGA